MEKKLTKSLPKLPGVYLFKGADGKVIYIGKAKSLKHRVSSYFQKNHGDWKVDALLAEYADLDFILTKSDTQAILLETSLIQQHKPKFNTLFKDGQPFLYIVITNEELPQIKLVRNKKIKGIYFGPFFHKMQVRRAYRFLIQTFRLNLCNKKIDNGCLDYHLGLCPGNCRQDFDAADYVFRIRLATDVLKKNHADFLHKLQEKIKEYSAARAYERAQHLQEYIKNLDMIFHTIDEHFSEKKFETDIFVAMTPPPTLPSEAEYLAKELQTFIKLPVPARVIDCFDISHFQGKQMVGSCIRFTDGKPEKNKFRRFIIKTVHEQNDYAALQEIVTRRYKDLSELPDVMVIDGGKGQLNAIRNLFPTISCISLAKREERLYSAQHPDGFVLDIESPIGKILIALRDYAHHFAINFHRLKRKKTLNQQG
jgi:excinuclease ABC subunit C